MLLTLLIAPVEPGMHSAFKRFFRRFAAHSESRGV
jgi:hypothetical protein